MWPAEKTRTEADPATATGLSGTGFSRRGFTGHTWTLGTQATGVAVPAGKVRTRSGQMRAIGERYHILRHLAAGGMGELYLARAKDSQRIVAIKRVHEHLAERTKIIRMFRDEARLAAAIDHPNVVRVVDQQIGDSSEAFIAMEYVAGKTLADLVRRVRPPSLLSVGIVAQAAAGLHAAHELRDEHGKLVGTVHQDVSPQNILIGYDGVVKVIDFGVARTHETTYCVDMNAIRGKLAYMAPEQMRAERLDRRVDVFALGIVLYEITTMTRLFKAKTEDAIRDRVLHRRITPPSAIVPDYPPDLEQVVLRALERDPARRFQTAGELHQALRRVLAHRAPTINNAIASMMSQVFGNRRVRRQLEKRGVHRLCGRDCGCQPSSCSADLEQSDCAGESGEYDLLPADDATDVEEATQTYTETSVDAARAPSPLDLLDDLPLGGPTTASAIDLLDEPPPMPHDASAADLLADLPIQDDLPTYDDIAEPHYSVGEHDRMLDMLRETQRDPDRR